MTVARIPDRRRICRSTSRPRGVALQPSSLARRVRHQLRVRWCATRWSFQLCLQQGACGPCAFKDMGHLWRSRDRSPRRRHRIPARSCCLRCTLGRTGRSRTPCPSDGTGQRWSWARASHLWTLEGRRQPGRVLPGPSACPGKACREMQNAAKRLASRSLPLLGAHTARAAGWRRPPACRLRESRAHTARRMPASHVAQARPVVGGSTGCSSRPLFAVPRLREQGRSAPPASPHTNRVTVAGARRGLINATSCSPRQKPGQTLGKTVLHWEGTWRRL